VHFTSEIIQHSHFAALMICSTNSKYSSMMRITTDIMEYSHCDINELEAADSSQWRSRTFGRPGRWSNLPPFRLRFL